VLSRPPYSIADDDDEAIGSRPAGSPLTLKVSKCESFYDDDDIMFGVCGACLFGGQN
jgi:hypothetical protein